MARIIAKATAGESIVCFARTNAERPLTTNFGGSGPRLRLFEDDGPDGKSVFAVGG
jgi:hypothetical protein